MIAIPFPSPPHKRAPVGSRPETGLLILSRGRGDRGLQTGAMSPAVIPVDVPPFGTNLSSRLEIDFPPPLSSFPRDRDSTPSVERDTPTFRDLADGRLLLFLPLYISEMFFPARRDLDMHARRLVRSSSESACPAVRRGGTWFVGDQR